MYVSASSVLTVFTVILNANLCIHVYTYALLTLYLYYTVHEEALLSLRKVRTCFATKCKPFSSAELDIKTLNAKYRLTTDTALVLTMLQLVTT